MMSLRSLGCRMSILIQGRTSWQIQPSVITSLRFRFRRYVAVQLSVPLSETSIKCNLNAIANSPLAGKNQARERGSVQKGRQLEIWSYHRHRLGKSLLLIMQQRPKPSIHSDSSCSLIYLPAEPNVFHGESHFKLELARRSVTRRHPASATLNLIWIWWHNLTYIELVCNDSQNSKKINPVSIL